MYSVYTDYPLPDRPDRITVRGRFDVKQVTVLTWDRDKYCEVLYEGHIYEVKRWYLYKDLALGLLISPRELEKLPEPGQYTINLVDNNQINITFDT